MPSPFAKYQLLLDQKEIDADERQHEVVQAFENLFQQITSPKNDSWWKKLIGTDKLNNKGLYIHGHVGRGKTFLMDLFVESLNPEIITRKHFHEFMTWFHKQLRQEKKVVDPIEAIIKKLSTKTQVLCLDEFLVLDITDAMILSGILKSLSKHSIHLVTTSNIEPKDLYYGGLQRKKFLPAIAWLENNTNILHLGGDKDFRQQHSSSQNLWLYPSNQQNEHLFEEQFSKIIQHETLTLDPIEISKRKIPVIKRSEYYGMFEFESLCADARSAQDYLELSKIYKAIFIVINHKIDDEDRNTARRFINLIDVFYDRETPIFALSVVDFTQMYNGKELQFEMQRTHSRLTEMQSFNLS